MNALRALFLSIGGAVGVVYPFIAVILLGRGFDVVGVGVVTALSALAFTASVPVWGHIADVSLGRPRALQVSAIGGGLALAVTLLPVPPLVVALCFVAFSASESAFAPLSDALAVNGVKDARRDYARVRLMSSLSFAVSTIVAGFVYDRTGYLPMPILFGLAAVVVVASAAFVPDVERADLAAMAVQADPGAAAVDPMASSAEAAASGAGAGATVAGGRDRMGDGTTRRLGSTSVALALAPRLPMALLAIGLIHVGILAGFTFLSVRLEQLGAEPSAIALSAGVSAFAEIPAFLVMGGLAQRVGIRGVFVFAVLIYSACFVSWMVLASPILIIATRVLTGFGFAGVGVAAVLTIATLLPDRLQGTGQALYQTTAFGLAAIVADVGGGIVYGTFGYAAVFGLAALAGLSAAVVGMAALPRGRVRLATAPRVG
jgi:PPP family 3-phenylpropionic acid transporter